MKKKIVFSLLFLAAQHLAVAQMTHWKGTLNENVSVPVAGLLHLKNEPTPSSALTLTEALNTAFDSICNASLVKGFNAAMLLPDGSMWKRAYGRAKEIPAIEPLSTEHLMAMGSITKSFVAATLLTMADDTLLRLDDSIGQYLDPYPNIAGRATIRQLLSHRTGFSDYLNENPAAADAWVNNLDSIWVADTLLNNYVLAPNFPVGAGWSYSNTNFLLAGRIIENITGEPWYMAVRERILVPLGLTHTFAYPWETPGNQPVSNLFADIDDDGIIDDVQGNEIPLEGFYSLANSAGNLLSSPEDIVKFNKAVHGGTVLKPATLAAMHTNYGFGYGLGTFFIDVPGLPNWGHNGDLLYKSTGFYFPAEAMSLAVQQNDNRAADEDMPDFIDVDVVFGILLETFLNFEPSSAVNDVAPAQGVRVFPNPAQDVLNITVLETASLPLQVQMSDYTGRIVFSQTIQNEQFTVPVGQVPAGVYSLRAGGFVQKVVIGSH